MLYTLCYVSSSHDNLSAKDLEHLFRVNKRNNTDLDVSGILIYNNGNFLQILEGDENKVKSLFKKIQGDSRHNNLITLINDNIEERIFHDYDSGFIHFEDPVKRKELHNYIGWLKEAEVKNVDKVVRIVENFIGKS